MNTPTKIVVILMILAISIYIVWGFNTKSKIEQGDTQSGDLLTSGDSLNEMDIFYEVSSGDNKIVLKGISEGSTSITTYEFQDGKLSEIILEEIITSGDAELIENIFNYMRNDTEVSMVYSTIEMEGNTITAILREEYVDAYGEATQEEIYTELINTLEIENN